eukprot:197544_1
MEKERLEKERLRKEIMKKIYINQLDTFHLKLKDIHFVAINALNDEIITEYNDTYKPKYDELQKEHDRLNKDHPQVITNPYIKQILLLGATGSGKSSFGNRLCNEASKDGDQGAVKPKSNDAVQSTTSSIQR